MVLFQSKSDLLSIVMCGRMLILHRNEKLVTYKLKRINNNNNNSNDNSNSNNNNNNDNYY